MTNYREAGVDIDVGDQFVEDIASLVAKTRRPEVLGDVGGFAGLFALNIFEVDKIKMMIMKKSMVKIVGNII